MLVYILIVLCILSSIDLYIFFVCLLSVIIILLNFFFIFMYYAVTAVMLSIIKYFFVMILNFCYKILLYEYMQRHLSRTTGRQDGRL